MENEVKNEYLKTVEEENKRINKAVDVFLLLEMNFPKTTLKTANELAEDHETEYDDSDLEMIDEWVAYDEGEGPCPYDIKDDDFGPRGYELEELDRLNEGWNDTTKSLYSSLKDKDFEIAKRIIAAIEILKDVDEDDIDIFLTHIKRVRQKIKEIKDSEGQMLIRAFEEAENEENLGIIMQRYIDHVYEWDTFEGIYAERRYGKERLLKELKKIDEERKRYEAYKKSIQIMTCLFEYLTNIPNYEMSMQD